MAVYTVGQQIETAFNYLGVNDPLDKPDLMAKGLVAFNQLLSLWSIDELLVYTSQDQSFTWPASTATRTLGPTGDFVGTRPVNVARGTYYVSDGTTTVVTLLNRTDYSDIALKNTEGLPQYLFVDMTSPDVTLYQYPIGNVSLEWHFISPLPIAEATDLTTSLYLPPGYDLAIPSNLAVLLSGGHTGLSLPENVAKIANGSRAIVKSNNLPSNILKMPNGLPGMYGRYNIVTDG